MGCVIGVAIRYLLYVAGLPNYLEEHLELNSPMTSHQRLKEGLFLLSSGVSPYMGDTCHHPPLLLILLSPLRDRPALAHLVLVTLVDLAIALLLRWLAVQYAAAKAQAGKPWAEASVRLVDPSKSKLASANIALEDVVSPAFVGLLYLLNPFTIASCLALSMQNVHHLAFVGAVCLAGSGRGGAAAAVLALALYVCPFTPILLLVPCAYLSFVQREAASGVEVDDGYKYRRSKDCSFLEPAFLLYLVQFGVTVFVLFMLLMGSSVTAMGGDLHFLQASFASILTVRDLTPNVGIFWYITIEVFDRYRALFILAFQGHILFYSAPLHLRIGRHRPIGPWLHCAAAIGIITLFKPYPTASDYGLMVSVLLVQVELIREAEKMFAFLLSGLLLGISMFPTMSAVWLTRNAGNANFLYNMTLIINVFGCLLLTEWLRAGQKLRMRRHISAFCRGIIFEAADHVVEGKTSGSGNSDGVAVAGTPLPDKVGATEAEEEADSSGLRHRPAAGPLKG